jgi:hypothetical protein
MILKKYFRQKIGEKIGVFDSKQSSILQNFDHNIVFFGGKNAIFSPKIVENRRKL